VTGRRCSASSASRQPPSGTTARAAGGTAPAPPRAREPPRRAREAVTGREGGGPPPTPFLFPGEESDSSAFGNQVVSKSNYTYDACLEGRPPAGCFSKDNRADHRVGASGVVQLPLQFQSSSSGSARRAAEDGGIWHVLLELFLKHGTV